MKRSTELSSRVVDEIVQRSRQQNRAICAQYDSIVNRVSAQCENTHHLVDLQKYIDALTVTELVDLRDRLRISADNILFLMDYALLPGGMNEKLGFK